jgi:hypothetical protein
MLYRNFTEGKMNRDVDERILPAGEYRSATNIEIINSEGSDVGAIENTLSTKQLTNINLGINVKTIGSYSDEPEDKIYWFVKSDSGCYLLEWDDINQVSTLVLQDTRTEDVNRVLNLKEDKLITGIVKVVSEDTKKDLLLWTDDNIDPCCINIERAKTWAVNGFEKEDIFLIKKQPKNAPGAIPTYSSEESNFIEERFVTFATRYRYLDGERSAISTYTNYNFNPKKFKIDYQSMENIGMVNNFNAIRLTFDTGPKQVVGIELIAKESNSNVLYLVESFNKEKEGWGDDQEKDFVFSNNKLYDVIDESELFRTFDNVPRAAKALSLIENVPVFGNYLENYDIKDSEGKPIRIDYTLDIESNDLTGTPLTVGFTGSDLLIINFPGSVEYKKGQRLIIELQMLDITYGGKYSDFIEFILPKDFIDANDMADNDDFKFFVTDILSLRFLQGLTIALPVNYSQTGQTSFAITSSSPTSITISAISLDYTIDNSPSPDTFETIDFEFSGSTTANYSTLESFSSCKTNMEYEAGIIYQDEWMRKSTVLTSLKNTVFIPLKLSVFQNKLLININNPAPYWAKSYKIAIKSRPLAYQTIYATVFYPDGLFRWVKLEGANKDKVKEGDTLIVKSDLAGPLKEVIKTRVIEISQKDKDFIEANTDGDGNDIIEQAGLYMKIKPRGYDMSFKDNTIINIDKVAAAGKNRQEARQNEAILTAFFGNETDRTAWKNTTENNELKKPAIVVTEFNVFNEADGTFLEKQPIIAGSKIDIYFRVYEDGIGTVGEYEKDFIASAAYEDIKAWYEAEVVDLGAQADNFDITFEEGVSGEIRLLVQGNNTGSPQSSKQSRLVVRMDVVLVEGIMIFETEPKQSDENKYFEAEQVFDIENGLHKANVQDQTNSLPAVINLDFFNCYVQGNGAESYRIKDAVNQKFLNIDLKPTSTSIEPYKEIRRFADMTYGEAFVESTNFNGLNVFNLSKGNFKELDKQYGSIQLLYSRDTNIVVFQEDKTSYVLFGKDIINQANGIPAITAIPEILGQQVPYQGENGIGKNPESFAVDAYRGYFINPRKGTPIRLSNDGTTEINYGMISYFRDLLINNPTSKKLGGFDPYHKKYVLTASDEVQATFKSFCGNSIFKQVTEAFSYDFVLNELVGDVVLDYGIVGGNVTIQAVFDGITTVASNVTGTGQLTFARTNVNLDTVAVTVTPVTGTPVISITNQCPEGSELKITSIVLADSGDIGRTIINRFKRGTGQFYSDSEFFTSEGVNKFLIETGTEGVGKFPASGETITIQSFKDTYTTGKFYPERGNRIGYLVSTTVYVDTDIATIIAAATFPTLTKTVSGLSTEIHSGSFIFTRPSAAHHLYLIYDYRDNAVVANDDSIDIFQGDSFSLNVLFNDVNVWDSVVEIISGPSNGTAFVTPTKLIKYTHNNGASTSDSITYRVFNGSSYDTAVINIGITSDPRVPGGGTGGTDVDGRAYSQSISGYTSPANEGEGACGFTLDTTKYHDGASPNPTLDDFIFNDLAKSTPFNGLNRYYRIPGGRSIKVATNGRVLDLWICGAGNA